MVPMGIASGLLLTVGLILLGEIPAAAIGAKLTGPHPSGGVQLVDTFVQDASFVGAIVLSVKLGGRTVKSWQFGLRPAAIWQAIGLALLTLLGFFAFEEIWARALNVSTKEKLLEQLGANTSTTLLLLSAAFTTVMAPICEEFVFRGFIFRSLSGWLGTWPAAIITGLLFGAVHVGSAPVVDLFPLAVLGFGLCLLYRYTGSLYPCIAVHSLNNAIAFGVLEEWNVGQTVGLAAAALALIWLLATILRAIGVIAPEAPGATAEPITP
jgi:membrane protease YdiL (CAAX protease family)